MRKKSFGICAVLLTAVILCRGLPFGVFPTVHAATFEQPVQTPQTITQQQWNTEADANVGRIPNSAIKSYSTNASPQQYGSSYLKYAFDDIPSTHWETGKRNTDTYHNYVDVVFSANQTVSRIEYAPRADGAAGKGCALKYKLYYSATESGDFQLLKEGGFPVPYSGIVSISFPSTNIKKFRFEFVEAWGNPGDDGWASMSMLHFFSRDIGDYPANEILLNVFTDNTFSTLRAGITAADIDRQIAAAASLSPVSKNKVTEILGEAKSRLLNNPSFFDNMTFELSQRGNMGVNKSRVHMQLGLYSFDATGFYVKPNETVSVYADYDPSDPAPTLVFGQFAEIRGTQSGFKTDGWIRMYPLKPGINIITAPAWTEAEEQNNFAPSAIYFNNDYSPADQHRAPKVRLVGGTRFPMYVHGVTDPQKFKEELDAYAQNIVPTAQEESEFNRTANNLTSKYFDICESVSDNVILTSSTSGCQKALAANPFGKTMADTMDNWEAMYKHYMDVSGFDTENPDAPNYMPTGKFICRAFYVKNDGVGAYATTGYTAYNTGTGNKQSSGNDYTNIFKFDSLDKAGGWGFFHEIGHQFDNSDTVRGEVTNNLFSLMMQDYFQPYPSQNRLDKNGPPGGGGAQNMWAKIKDGNISGQHPMLHQGSSTSTSYNDPEPTNQDGNNVWYQLAEIYQTFLVYDAECMQKTGRNLYGAMVNEFINSPEKYTRNTNRTIAVQNMALAMSNAVGKDITSHFEHYNHPITIDAKQTAGVIALPKDVGRKTWYADAKLRDPASTGFTRPDIVPKVTYTSGSGITLNMSLAGESAKSFLCYEISKNGNIIGLAYGADNSTSATFTDPSGTADTEYTVVAYDRRCYPSQPKKGSMNNPGNIFALDYVTSNTTVEVNSPVVWTASASGGTGVPQYKFDLYMNGQLLIPGEYTADNTYNYIPTMAGQYYVKAYAKTSTEAEQSLTSATVTAVPKGSVKADFFEDFSDYTSAGTWRRTKEDQNGSIDTGVSLVSGTQYTGGKAIKITNMSQNYPVYTTDWPSAKAFTFTARMRSAYSSSGNAVLGLMFRTQDKSNSFDPKGSAWNSCMLKGNAGSNNIFLEKEGIWKDPLGEPFVTKKAPRVGEWYIYSVSVSESGELSVYLDGELIGEEAAANLGFEFSNNDGFFGFRSWGSTQTFEIDWVSIGKYSTDASSAATITSQPADGAELNVQAIPSPGGVLSYRWQSSSNNGYTWADIDGATDSTYIPAGASDLLYRCAVINTAANARTKVNYTNEVNFDDGSATAPIILTQPTDLNINIGHAAPLSVTASVSKGTLSYQWYEASGKTNTNGVAIPGADSASFTPSAAAIGVRYYYCVVTNTYVSPIAGTQTAQTVSRAVSVSVTENYIITVIESPPNGGKTDGSGIYQSGSPVTIIATPNPGYEFDGWYKNGVKLSDDEIYTFPATVTGMYEAKFVKVEFKIKNVDISGAPAAGNRLTFTANASGGTMPIKYAFYIVGNGRVYYKSTAYSANNSFSYTPNCMGDYTLIVYAADAAGKTVSYTKQFTVG